MSALPTEAKLGIPKMFLNRHMEQEQEAHACKTTQSQRWEVCNVCYSSHQAPWRGSDQTEMCPQEAHL